MINAAWADARATREYGEMGGSKEDDQGMNNGNGKQVKRFNRWSALRLLASALFPASRDWKCSACLSISFPERLTRCAGRR